MTDVVEEERERRPLRVHVGCEVEGVVGGV